MSKSEYTNSAVSGGNQSCNYNTLCNYYGTPPTVPSSYMAASKGHILVTPSFGGVGYNTLSHGNTGGCKSYFTMKSAYGGNKNCSSYKSPLCNQNCN